MSRRFQFSFVSLLASGACLAVSCVLLRLAFDRDSRISDAMRAVFVVLAMTITGAAVGCLVNRPLIGAAVGFLFAVPDLLRERRGMPLDTFIIKTVAILPRRELSGLGAVLVGEAQELGKQMGFRRCIHALMQKGNMLARNISRAYAKPIRTYTLFAQDLRA